MCVVTPMMARYWQDVLYSQLSLPVPLVQGKGNCESCLQRLRPCVGDAGSPVNQALSIMVPGRY